MEQQKRERWENIYSKKGWIEFYEVAHEVHNYLK